jgi:prepilin-type N-terminal cleavage/methylation domain-containing protein
MKSPQTGFSLIEIMVVVAIIGILATLALPNYQKFQSRARQTSAKSELAAIFAAEKSFHAEYGNYQGMWPQIGFIPSGFAGVTDFYSYALPGSKRYYFSVSCDTGIDCNKSPTDLASFGLPLGVYNWEGFYAAELAYCPIDFADPIGFADTFGRTVTSSTFTAVMIGCPRQPLGSIDFGAMDVWTINESRVVRNRQSGL